MGDQAVPPRTIKRSRSKSGTRKSVCFSVDTKNDLEREILELEGYFKKDWNVNQIPPDMELIALKSMKNDDSSRMSMAEHKLLISFLTFKTQSTEEKLKITKKLEHFQPDEQQEGYLILRASLLARFYLELKDSEMASNYLEVYNTLEKKIKESCLVEEHPEVIACKAFGMATLLDYLPLFVSKVDLKVNLQLSTLNLIFYV